jgi:hypothetical protein
MPEEYFDKWRFLLYFMTILSFYISSYILSEFGGWRIVQSIKQEVSVLCEFVAISVTA